MADDFSLASDQRHPETRQEQTMIDRENHGAFADPIATMIDAREFRLLIGGRLIDAADGATMTTTDPSTGRHLTSVPRADKADVDAAYAAAANAQPGWDALGLAGRVDVLARVAEAIESEAERLATLDAIDGGLPLAGAREDVDEAVASLRAWPTLARWHGGRTIPASRANLHYTSYRPYGVVGRILAYNHPLFFAVGTTVSALLAGNTVIVKPAPQVPLSALALGEIVRGIFPPGVFNVVTGGAEAGDAIVTHPQIKRVGFTGSVTTGRTILQRAATVGIKHVTLELGGKNPMIVFPDADLDRAVRGAVSGMNFGVCAGQSCESNSRTYVHETIYDEFLQGVPEQLSAMRVGPAYADGVDMGPLVSADHLDRVADFVRSGMSEARLVAGGERPTDPTCDGGYFLTPTLFADVTPVMRMAREEIFGPVMATAPWSDTNEVLAIANDTEYGLTAAVWTRDLDSAHRIAGAPGCRIRVGQPQCRAFLRNSVWWSQRERPRTRGVHRGVRKLSRDQGHPRRVR
jgi:acyl-CoA reductase-like NAD-dependent aldehyde dehydrogenase